MAVPWVVEMLADGHDRSNFSCGKPSLDDFLKHLAGQHAKRDFARTYVATIPPDLAVLGYYSLSAGSVDLLVLPEADRKKLPKHPVPVAHLGRLAVDQRAQGQKLGKFLLIDALRRCSGLSTELGLHAIEVVALDDSARAFYLKYGFTPLTDDRLHLWIPMKVVRKLGL
jgi:GNAT superfamily N-acetyltransferase